MTGDDDDDTAALAFRSDADLPCVAEQIDIKRESTSDGKRNTHHERQAMVAASTKTLATRCRCSTTAAASCCCSCRSCSLRKQSRISESTTSNERIARFASRACFAGRRRARRHVARMRSCRERRRRRRLIQRRHARRCRRDVRARRRIRLTHGWRNCGEAITQNDVIRRRAIVQTRTCKRRALGSFFTGRSGRSETRFQRCDSARLSD